MQSRYEDPGVGCSTKTRVISSKFQAVRPPKMANSGWVHPKLPGLGTPPIMFVYTSKLIQCVIQR